MEKKKIELYSKSDQLVNAAVDKVVVDLFNKKGNCVGGQAIVMTGCSPISGVTSTSIALGIAMAASKRKTLIIDCDVRKAVQYKKLNDEVTYGVAEYLLKDELQFADVIYSTNIDGLSYMPCGEYSNQPTRVLCSPKMGQLIANAKKEYDCIFLDVPSIAVVPDAQILFPMADGIILMSALGETRKKQIRDARLKLAPFAEKYYGMIVNKIPMDVYRQNEKDFDYYFVNKKGQQKFYKNEAYQKFKKKQKKNKQEVANDEEDV